MLHGLFRTLISISHYNYNFPPFLPPAEVVQEREHPRRPAALPGDEAAVRRLGDDGHAGAVRRATTDVGVLEEKYNSV